ncbi:hypothetical protein ZIOFF_065732 [Zingiber officinale]|uniref:Uncharacterized protein n=1 Tax=Zingiber officinale TaxID=94328 RepID=A0A8J5K909_ZINOF|nr:hypothetical protein ZIOFF_065732 [Zingiber officinale]
MGYGLRLVGVGSLKMKISRCCGWRWKRWRRNGEIDGVVREKRWSAGGGEVEVDCIPLVVVERKNESAVIPSGIRKQKNTMHSPLSSFSFRACLLEGVDKASSYGGCWFRNSYDECCAKLVEPSESSEARVVDEGKAFQLVGEPPATLRLTSEPLVARLQANEPLTACQLTHTRSGLEVSRELAGEEGVESEIDEGI